MLTQVHQNKKGKEKREGESGIIAGTFRDEPLASTVTEGRGGEKWRVTQERSLVTGPDRELS